MDKIYSKHKHWIEVVKNFGETFYAEDIVQEAYIKTLGKNINEAYFYYTLRSMTMDLHRKKVNTIELEDNITEKDFDTYLQEETKQHYKVMDNWHFYDKQLFIAFIESNLSIRAFSRSLDISFQSVYGTIKKCKLKLKIEWQKQELQDKKQRD
jgi:DNA-directed RNA polymerase specialized sigma24 family protein